MLRHPPACDNGMSPPKPLPHGARALHILDAIRDGSAIPLPAAARELRTTVRQLMRMPGFARVRSGKNWFTSRAEIGRLTGGQK